ncbi:UNVERIFIED_CONTAM: hypothetical protein Sradi_0699400 [Sesamum radiatum]|uniref:Retrotransposon gag domain-containing protein n=1 Tax=Sesamum radiatum TaxID=300843 RepID=A0AAW2VLV7_SESRA
MNTRSRARNGNGGGDLDGVSGHVPQGEVQQPFGPRKRERIGGLRGGRNKSELLLPNDPNNPRSPPTDDRGRLSASCVQGGCAVRCRARGATTTPSSPRERTRSRCGPRKHNHGLTDQQAREQLEEEVESRPSLPEEELPPPPPREAPLEEDKSQRRGQAAARPASIGRTADAQAFPLAVAPPRRSPFATHILAEAIQPGIKIPNISEYDGTKDPQDHLDRFLAKADLLDLSDAAYCKIFRTTLAGKAMAWFNQLPIGTIDSFEQLSQYFLHHFAINKRYPKIA